MTVAIAALVFGTALISITALAVVLAIGRAMYHTFYQPEDRK